jgi:hypothetical protein
MSALKELMQPFEAAAQRQRQSVRPYGGRQEGAATSGLESVLMQLLTLPARAGQAAVQYGDTGEYNPAPFLEAGAALVGGPAVFGGVPAASLGSGASRMMGRNGNMSRNGLLENQDHYRRAAIEARNEGRGGTVRVYKDQAELDRAQGGVAAKDSFDRAAQKARADFGNTSSSALEDFRRAVYPERYPSMVDPKTESVAQLFARYKNNDDFVTFGAGGVGLPLAILMAGGNEQ